MKPNKYLDDLLKRMDEAMKGYKAPEISQETLIEASFQATLAFAKLAFIRSQALKNPDEEMQMLLGESEFFFETIQKKTNSLEREIYMRKALEPIVEQMQMKERTVN